MMLICKHNYLRSFYLQHLCCCSEFTVTFLEQKILNHSSLSFLTRSPYWSWQCSVSPTIYFRFWHKHSEPIRAMFTDTMRNKRVLRSQTHSIAATCKELLHHVQELVFADRDQGLFNRYSSFSNITSDVVR